jgi:hypothetical protein
MRSEADHLVIAMGIGMKRTKTLLSCVLLWVHLVHYVDVMLGADASFLKQILDKICTK